MRFNGDGEGWIELRTGDRTVFIVACAPGTRHEVTIPMDENHATALALALQAAVAEIQARAVSR